MSTEHKILHFGLVYFTISSWGHTHCYGTFRYMKNAHLSCTHMIEYTLTKSQAKRLNILDGCKCYEKGDTSPRFFSRLDCYKAAKSFFNQIPQGIALVEGEPSDANPLEVLRGPEPWKTEINKLPRDNYNRWSKKMAELFPKE